MIIHGGGVLWFGLGFGFGWLLGGLGGVEWHNLVLLEKMRLGDLRGKFGMSIFVALQLLVFLVLQGHAAVVQYDWTVDYLSATPDCVSKLVFAINGQFPSPTIYAVEGDTVEVKLKNALPTEGVVLHWHGIYQVRNYHSPFKILSETISAHHHIHTTTCTSIQLHSPCWIVKFRGHSEST